MKLRFDAEVEEFRAEFESWLAENSPSAKEMSADPPLSTAHSPDWARRWTRRLFDDGWLVPGWPPKLGGRNASPSETLVYLEALSQAGVPRTTNPQGLGIVAPSIVDHGTNEQVEQYALPLLRGEMTACLGMSEPDAGSDLAALKTRATRDGDNFVLSGQKVWTSGAAFADFCLLFCRTDPDAPKHAGISVVLVPMNAPGVTVRPLNEIVHPDDPDLTEVFLDDVVVPASNLVGELNNGWRLASGSLAHERSMVWLDSVLDLEACSRHLIEKMPAYTAEMSDAENAVAADSVVQLYIETWAARCLGFRAFARFVKHGSAAEQALMKAYASETRRDLARVASELGGAEALVATASREGIGSGGVGTIEDYFGTFFQTISAGTSDFKGKIIGERVLGLPRE
jgi:alkylation response protein AidB-like acyl-CoA dehydrogenase